MSLSSTMLIHRAPPQELVVARAENREKEKEMYSDPKVGGPTLGTNHGICCHVITAAATPHSGMLGAACGIDV